MLPELHVDICDKRQRLPVDWQQLFLDMPTSFQSGLLEQAKNYNNPQEGTLNQV